MKVNRDGVGGDGEVHIMAPFFFFCLGRADGLENSIEEYNNSRAIFILGRL